MSVGEQQNWADIRRSRKMCKATKLTKDKGYEKDPHRLIAKLMTRIPARLKPDTITFDFMMEIVSSVVLW